MSCLSKFNWSLISLETFRENALSIESLAEYGVWKDYELRDRFLSFSSILMDILMSPALLPLPVSSPSEKVPLYGGINAACERGLDDAAVPVFRGQWRTEFNEGHSQVLGPKLLLAMGCAKLG